MDYKFNLFKNIIWPHIIISRGKNLPMSSEEFYRNGNGGKVKAKIWEMFMEKKRQDFGCEGQ